MAACISDGNLSAILVLVTIMLSHSSRAESNKPPKISIGLPYSGKKAILILSEDTPLNSYLGIMETKDEDIGPAGEVDCRTDNYYVRIPLVYPNTFKIELSRQLDREMANVSQVIILCSDKGTPPMTSTAVFNIEVTDINDNAPIFGNSSYDISITEGVDVGTFLTMVTATDPDSIPNGIIEYSLYDDSANSSICFKIDPTTGQIVTSCVIDRELVNQYVLVVVAADSGLPALFSSVDVRISVEDINDNAPVVLTKEIHVKENQKPMEHVGIINASDTDFGRNAELVFSKVEDSEFSSSTPFLVQSNGEIISAVSLDRELRSQYTMEVSVRDKGNPRQSSLAKIIIIVDDINDNAPIITSPCLYDDDDDDNVINFGKVSNDSSRGSITIDWYSPEDKKVVYQVLAEDDDIGENSQLRFAIETVTSYDTFNKAPTPQNDPLFRINEQTGELLLARFLRRNDQFQQLINISVIDKGDPALTAFCVLNVTFSVDLGHLTTSKTTKPRTVKSNRRRRKYGNGASISGFFATKYFLLVLIFLNFVIKF